MSACLAMIVHVSRAPVSRSSPAGCRYDQRMLGNEQKEATLLQEAPSPKGQNFYKDLSLECSKYQISVDMFLFSPQYTDLASLVQLPKYTGGQLYHYQAFELGRDGQKLSTDLKRNLTRETGFEAVMRVRCSKGMKVTGFYGNFLLKGQDLMALPNIDADKAFGCELGYEEQMLTSNAICVQCALYGPPVVPHPQEPSFGPPPPR